MGGVCSGGTSSIQDASQGSKFSGFTGKFSPINGSTKQKEVSLSPQSENGHQKTPQKDVLQKLPEMVSSGSKPVTPRGKGVTKKTEKSSVLGKTGTLGLKKAVQVLDTLGKSVPNLKTGKEFVNGMVSRGSKISILAFELANTIVKGTNLLESLSQRNVQSLKEILRSKGVQQLVLTDMNLLLMIAAADKREEFHVFLQEVIRFGDICKDPQWHNLGRYFPISEFVNSNHNISAEEAEATIRELSALARHTSELYHELNALDRFEQDYKQKQEEVKSLNLPQRGEDLMILQDEVKLQRKLVKSLKKKSLWSKNIEEIMVKFVDVLAYINQKFMEAFGNNGTAALVGESAKKYHASSKLGPAGLALHYANIIVQIDTIASRPACLPTNVRESLYHSLPAGVKKALHSRLRATDVNEQLPLTRAKVEMDKTLKWLVPAATNTIKVHQKFGWVGDWAVSSKERSKATSTRNDMIRLQTLYHADKEKTDLYILELVTWLHRLVNLAKQRINAIAPLPGGSPINRKRNLQSKVRQFPPMTYTAPKPKENPINPAKLSQEDQNLLEAVLKRTSLPGISKSQELKKPEKSQSQIRRLSQSEQSSPSKDLISTSESEELSTDQLNPMDGLSEHCELT